MPEPSAIQLNPLPPFCIECGYNLQGLPHKSDCPECGTNYGPEVFILAGWGFGRFESISNAEPGRLVKSISFFVILAVAGAILCFTRHEILPGIFLMVFFIGVITWQLLKRRRLIRAFGKPYRARICPKGFGQRIGYGPLQLASWSDPHDLELVAVNDDRHRLRIRLHNYIVDAVCLEFDCTHLQATFLSEAISRFRNSVNSASPSTNVK